MKSEKEKVDLSRRRFFGQGAFLGAALATGALGQNVLASEERLKNSDEAEYPFNKPENILYSVSLVSS